MWGRIQMKAHLRGETYDFSFLTEWEGLYVRLFMAFPHQFKGGVELEQRTIQNISYENFSFMVPRWPTEEGVGDTAHLNTWKVSVTSLH